MALQTRKAGQVGSASQQDNSGTGEIPDKLYFRIGDVAKICAVEPYVLRFWETQFPALKPNKGGTGQRLYRRREVELALRIKQLVHQEGYTLAGARQALENAPRIAPQMKANQANAVALPGATAAGTAAVSVGGQRDQSQQRLDSAAAAIGRVRAELRELVRELGQEQPSTQRRRSRITAFKPATDSLFDPFFSS